MAHLAVASGTASAAAMAAHAARRAATANTMAPCTRCEACCRARGTASRRCLAMRAAAAAAAGHSGAQVCSNTVDHVKARLIDQHLCMLRVAGCACGSSVDTPAWPCAQPMQERGPRTCAGGIRVRQAPVVLWLCRRAHSAQELRSGRLHPELLLSSVHMLLEVLHRTGWLGSAVTGELLFALVGWSCNDLHVRSPTARGEEFGACLAR